MKKASFIVFIMLFIMNLFSQEKPRIKARYYYVVGWEYSPIDGNLDFQPVVSNVFAMRCKEDQRIIDIGITNDFNGYYAAYYGKKRGFRGLVRMIAFGEYKTWEEAERDRRRSIVKYNYDWEPLLISGFAAFCE